MPRQIKLGVSMIGLGYHLANWRHPDAPADGNMSLPHFVRVIQAAERGLFDMGFLADGVGIRFHDEPKGALCRTAKNVQFEPLTLLSALAMVTKNIGLVATASTTYNEPYHVARKFASLDHISGGRAGWNVVTSVTDMEARNFNRDAARPPTRATRGRVPDRRRWCLSFRGLRRSRSAVGDGPLATVGPAAADRRRVPRSSCTGIGRRRRRGLP